MTRAQQIEAALKLISPPPGRRDQCGGNIADALDIMVDWDGVANVWRARGSKAAHKARRTYYRALRRLQVADKALRAAGGQVPGCLDLTTIERAIKATGPRRYQVRYRAGGPKQEAAVLLACELLTEWWGKEFVTTTRKGPWWRLSAILYGDPAYDLFRHLRALKGELNRRI
jgi:hypothetical protein